MSLRQAVTLMRGIRRGNQFKLVLCVMAIADRKAVYEAGRAAPLDAPRWLGSHDDYAPLPSKLHPDLHVVT